MHITVPEEQQRSVPVFKNLIYALKLVFKADKKLIIGYFLQQVCGGIFSMFIQNILFLKVLLEVISGADFHKYISYLTAFFVLSAIIKIFEWHGERLEQFATKNVLKKINNMV